MNQASAPEVCSGTPFPRTPQILFANWREAFHHSRSISYAVAPAPKEFLTADFTDFTDNFLRTFAIPHPVLIRAIRATVVNPLGASCWPKVSSSRMC